MNQVIKYKFIDGLTGTEIGERLGLTPDMVKYFETTARRRLRSNSRTKHLVMVYLGLNKKYEYM